MKPLQIQIEGIGVWAPGIRDYSQLSTAVTSVETLVAGPPESRPPAVALAANERRRAPEGVLLAVEVADQAIRMSSRTAAELLSVFSSCRGDQAISDYMCQTLASDPLALSPTKFHNSVHNAPAGYWGIAHGAMGASSAVSHEPQWPGLSLLDAIALVSTEQQPVLWVASETRGAGPLLELSGYSAGMACALVLAPAEPGARHLQVRADLRPTEASTIDDSQPPPHPVALLLPWLRQLHHGSQVALPVAPRLKLLLEHRADLP